MRERERERERERPRLKKKNVKIENVASTLKDLSTVQFIERKKEDTAEKRWKEKKHMGAL